MAQYKSIAMLDFKKLTSYEIYVHVHVKEGKQNFIIIFPKK